MKTALLKTMIISLAFVAMPAHAMLRPCVQALAAKRNVSQMFFLKNFYEATQETPKIKNVFFVTHQFDDFALSRRLQALQQCGVPVRVLVSHALAYKSSPSSELLLSDLHASGVAIKVFSEKYDDAAIDLKSDGNMDLETYIMQSVHLINQSNNMSLLVVQRKDKPNSTVVLQSGSEISMLNRHRQFDEIHKKISTVFRDKNESEDFKPKELIF